MFLNIIFYFTINKAFLCLHRKKNVSDRNVIEYACFYKFCFGTMEESVMKFWVQA